jgi:uncharacterized protein (DUF2235 family)
MKRLVIFCDGTWNTPDQKDRGVKCPSNVVKLRNLVERLMIPWHASQRHVQ